jgi:hypothetical protein
MFILENITPPTPPGGGAIIGLTGAGSAANFPPHPGRNFPGPSCLLISLNQRLPAFGSYNDRASFQLSSLFCVLFFSNVVIHILTHGLPIFVMSLPEGVGYRSLLFWGETLKTAE